MTFPACKIGEVIHPHSAQCSLSRDVFGCQTLLPIIQLIPGKNGNMLESCDTWWMTTSLLPELSSVVLDNFMLFLAPI